MARDGCGILMNAETQRRREVNHHARSLCASASLRSFPSFLVLLIYTFLALLPLYLMIVSALTRLGTSFDLSSLDWIPRDWAWRNFSEFFHLMQGSPFVWLRNTLMIALPTTLLNLLFSAM